MKKQTKLYKQRLEFLVNVIHQCLSIKIPLFLLRKVLKQLLKKENIDLQILTEKEFLILNEKLRDKFLNIKSEND
ncbi:hypothetical protein [Spiroplasma citri]|uniref:Plectrovirus-related protein n=1 Tax=Spiroplasma citri TaxID=2133 RepID=A0AAX3SXS2_SPICI|nr:hypothetical protein [Spiroplasma citri]APE75309.1 plectrovirus-related protein [Spiroplasma citri]QIA75405.1 hypothetical protein GTU57_06980 [Spiroplasma citri]WFG95946.1 hypothetical protein M0C40_07530 [Spiroplasma citri]WFG99832.1 hypothetical protein M1771_07475 [Spiroplasma citri]